MELRPSSRREPFTTGAIWTGEYRVVRNPKRKRELQKRGEDIWWSDEHQGWVWDFWKIPF